MNIVMIHICEKAKINQRENSYEESIFTNKVQYFISDTDASCISCDQHNV